jgi:DNA-binding transcriptional LysR family regulator
LVKAGVGLTLLPKAIAHAEREHEKLLRVLPDWQGQKVEFFAVFAPHLTSVPVVRHFLNFLISRLNSTTDR